MATTVNNNNIESKKAKAERQERYNARCKELEAEALAQMPYKVGDTVKNRDGVTGRVVEMYPEVTGDIDSPHLIYEYDGKPTVNVVILDADGKRRCAHWSFFTLQEASEIKDGTEVWTTIELHSEYGKRGKVVRKFFADHGVWCLNIEFEDGTKATYAEEYVTTEKPWAVVGAKCRHKYLDRDVALTITAVGQYYGIKAESEDGKVKRCGLVRDFVPCTPDGRDLLPEPPAEVHIDVEPTLETVSEIKDDSFFIKGKKYRCIKSVKGDFTKGKVYEQSSDPTQWYGYFRNDKGIHHVWPQPAQIDYSCELYDMKPEDVDPRLYFEPVSE